MNGKLVPPLQAPWAGAQRSSCRNHFRPSRGDVANTSSRSGRSAARPALGRARTPALSTCKCNHPPTHPPAHLPTNQSIHPSICPVRFLDVFYLFASIYYTMKWCMMKRHIMLYLSLLHAINPHHTNAHTVHHTCGHTCHAPHVRCIYKLQQWLIHTSVGYFSLEIASVHMLR